MLLEVGTITDDLKMYVHAKSKRNKGNTRLSNTKCVYKVIIYICNQISAIIIEHYCCKIKVIYLKANWMC